MDVPVAFDLKLLAAYDTLAFLLQPKFQPPLVPARLLYHLTLGAFFKVEFPRRVIRIGCPFDLDVSPDRCLVRLREADRANFARTIQPRPAEHLPSICVRVVFLGYPRRSLLRVSAGRSAPQRLTDLPVHFPERAPTRAVLMIVRPTANYRVELHDQVSGPGLRMRFDLRSYLVEHCHLSARRRGV